MPEPQQPPDDPLQPGLPLPEAGDGGTRREPPAWLRPVLEADAARARQKEQERQPQGPAAPPPVQGAMPIPPAGEPAEVPSTPWSPDRAWNRTPVPDPEPPRTQPAPADPAPQPEPLVLVEPPRAVRRESSPASSPPAPPGTAPDDVPRASPKVPLAEPPPPLGPEPAPDPGPGTPESGDQAEATMEPVAGQEPAGPAARTGASPAPAAAPEPETPAMAGAEPEAGGPSPARPADPAPPASTDAPLPGAGASPVPAAAGGGQQRNRGGGGAWIPIALVLALLLAGAGLALILGGDQVAGLVARPAPTPTPLPTPLPVVEPVATPGPVATPTPAPGWQQLAWQGAAPTSRRNMAVVASRDGSKVLIYGGVSDDTPARDTWLYDVASNTWRRLSPDANQPQGRFRGAVTLDSSRDRAVLFGGESGSAFFNDIWVFDFATEGWTQIAPRTTTAPSARVAPGLAYDPRGDRYIVTHGRAANGNLLDDTWAYSPVTNTWTELSPPPAPTATPTPRVTGTPVAGQTPAPAATPRPSRPPRLAFAPLIADELTGALYLIGGETADGPSNAVWQFDLVSGRWNPVGAAGPTPLPRTGFAATALPNGRLALFGGQVGDQRLDDLWFFETRTYEWRPSPLRGPSARSGAEMAYAPGQDRLWLFGGQDARGELADLWRVEAARLAPGPPPAR